MNSAVFEVGAELRSPFRPMTRERMRWYCDALDTAVADDGKFHIAGATIHNDDEFALAQGLPAIIADGMISTNWIYGFLLDNFGPPFLKRGELSTKFIRPVYEDQKVGVCARLRTKQPQEDGTTRCELDVWCEDDKGTVLTVGEAVAYLPVPA